MEHPLSGDADSWCHGEAVEWKQREGKADEVEPQYCNDGEVDVNMVYTGKECCREGNEMRLSQGKVSSIRVVPSGLATAQKMGGEEYILPVLGVDRGVSCTMVWPAVKLCNHAHSWYLEPGWPSLVTGMTDRWTARDK